MSAFVLVRAVAAYYYSSMHGDETCAHPQYPHLSKTKTQCAVKVDMRTSFIISKGSEVGSAQALVKNVDSVPMVMMKAVRTALADDAVQGCESPAPVRRAAAA